MPAAIRRYGFAVLAVGLALLVRLLLAPVLRENAPMMIFVLAVLLAAWRGGLGPGLFATAASAAAGLYFFLIPTYRPVHGPSILVHIGIFVAIGVAISVLNSRLSSATAHSASRLREIERLTAGLEQTVDLRTAELQEANRSLEAFAYSVSHDLRAPLRAIQGFAQALVEDYGDRLDETGQEYTRRVAGAAERMELLIQDILAYSRISRAELDLKPVSLAAAVEEAASQVEALRDGQGGEIVVEGPFPRTLAHRSTLTQVLVNLLNNALTFVAPGQAPRVRVRAEEREGWARLWVEDNGIGIAREHHERIFEVFERLHGREVYSGTGVGLAIVRKGIERMGGRVGVESEPGAGSRFWIELRRAEGEP